MAEEHLPGELAGPLKAFADDVAGRLHGALHSVTVYGSAARGDFIEGVSDVNVLVLASALPAEALASAGPAVRHWQEKMPLSPIFATPDYIQNSADVFPLEFLDMRDAHVTILGPDPFASLQIDPRMLRHQVEAELKGKLMRLRAAYVRAAGNPLAVRDLVRDSLSSFRILFGGVLRLQGKRPPANRAAVMSEVAGAYGLDAAALDCAVDVHEGDADATDAQEVFARYLAAIEKLVADVDTWNDNTQT